MKTPREFILERHRSADAKLKAIRAEDLAALASASARTVDSSATEIPSGLEVSILRSAAEGGRQSAAAFCSARQTPRNVTPATTTESRFALSPGERAGVRGKGILDILTRQIYTLATQSRQRLRELPTNFWRQSIHPWRRVWAGIAAAWLAILALHLGSGESPRSTPVQTARTNPQIVAALREQKDLLSQLLGPIATATLDRPKIPSPRSEQRHELFIA